MTRNVSLFKRMGSQLQQRVFEDVNAGIAEGNKFADIDSFVASSVASTLLDRSAVFALALMTLKGAGDKIAESYRSEDTREYARGYVNHLLNGHAYPQALNITLSRAISIRERIDKAISGAMFGKKFTKKNKKENK